MCPNFAILQQKTRESVYKIAYFCACKNEYVWPNHMQIVCIKENVHQNADKYLSGLKKYCKVMQKCGELKIVKQRVAEQKQKLPD